MERRSERFIRITELAYMLGVHYVTVRKWVKQGRFPEPKQLSSRISGWWVSDLPDWVQEKINIKN